MTKWGKEEYGVNYEEDLDQIDFQNYKGMFFNDDPGLKYQDEETGAHFEYRDMCRRLTEVKKRQQVCRTMNDENNSPYNLDETEDDSLNQRQKVRESRHVFKALQSFHLQDSRNAAPRPIQLYGSTIDHLPEKSKKDLPKKTNLERNYSINQKQYNGNIIKEATNYHNKDTAPRRPTFEELQNSIATLLEESKKLRRTYQQKTTASRPLCDSLKKDNKSRNITHKTQDRKTCCDVRLLTKDYKKSVAPQRTSCIYSTVIGKPEPAPLKKTPSVVTSKLKKSVIELPKGKVAWQPIAKNRSRQNDAISKKLHVVSLMQRYDTFAK